MNNTIDLIRPGKSSKVPYMGCQSLKYHNRISKLSDNAGSGSPRLSHLEAGSPTETQPPGSLSLNKPLHTPTALLIQQSSPDSIRSFSTCRSDNTMIGRNQSATISNQSDDQSLVMMPPDIAVVNDVPEISSIGCLYDVPPIEYSTTPKLATIKTNSFTQINHDNSTEIFDEKQQTPNLKDCHDNKQFRNSTTAVIRTKKKSSIFRKYSMKHSSVPANYHPLNNNLICGGIQTPHSALNKSLDSLPEAEHLKANLDPSLFKDYKFSRNQTNGKQVSYKNLFERLLNDKDMKWSKKCIKRPILDYIPKSLTKHCLKCFKAVQKYMGDHRTSKSPSELVVFLLVTVDRYPILSDEVMLHISKQTTDNLDKFSLSRGFELLAECLEKFTLSDKIVTYLELYINSCLNGNSSTTPLNINTCSLNPMVQQNLDRCVGIIQQRFSFTTNQHKTNAVLLPMPVNTTNESYRSQQHPMMSSHQRQRSLTQSYRQTAKHIDNQISFFNRSLAFQMEIQARTFPNDTVPLILTTLCNQIVYLIDEYSSFVDFFMSCSRVSRAEVINATLDIDRWCVNTCQSWHIQVPYLKNSALNILQNWFDSLPEPIMSNPISDIGNRSIRCTSDLPAVNQSVIEYIVTFFKDSVLDKGKDSIENISSFLCPLLYKLPNRLFYPQCLQTDNSQNNNTALFDNNTTGSSSSYDYTQQIIKQRTALIKSIITIFQDLNNK